MGLDSVELVMAFEEAFGIEIPDEDAARLETPRHVMDYVAARLPVTPSGACRTQRTFYALRRGLRAAGVTDVELRPGTPLGAFADRDAWPVLWTRARLRADRPDWPARMPWKGFWSEGPSTLGDLARAGSPWSLHRNAANRGRASRSSRWSARWSATRPVWRTSTTTTASSATCRSTDPSRSPAQSVYATSGRAK